MYGKIFASTFTGSLVGAGPVVYAVQGYIIANTKDSRVELNPVLLAMIIGTEEKEIEGAIEYLCQPDPRSRSKEHDGRRLIREGEFQYFVINHAKYRAIRNDDDRRAYFRQKKAEQRARENPSVSKHASKTVIDCPRQSNMSTQAEAEAKAESESETKAATAAAAAVPTVAEVIAFGAKYPGDLARGVPGPVPKDFCIAYHEAKEKQQTWVNRNGFMVKWELEIVGKGWWRDQWNTWGKAKPKVQQPALDPNDWRNSL
jgi:hypothetical protein